MLRVAVPNKGSLSEASVQMLREAGYRQRSSTRELVLHDADNDTEFFYLRPRDIATYVSAGQLDVGVTGRDLLLDSELEADASDAAAHEVLALGFASSTFRYATTPGVATDVTGFGGLRIATSYPGLVARHLAEHGVSATIIRLDGAVENSVRLGVADVIADVVETGTTLRQAGLELVGDPILRSEAILISRGDAPDAGAIEQLIRRLNGVIVARAYVIFDYDVRTDLLDAACRLTPGIESPTVAPLHDPGWVAVRALVPRADTNNVMDDLYQLGARGILVTDIHACRL